jgi:DNA-binding transcriptional LysR family regulator
MGKNENDYLHREIIRGEKRGSVNGDARVYTRSGIREFYPAADSLNMPIATLSKLVKSLEIHLEIRLLHRTTRRVVTTPEGAEYYEKALRVLIDIEEIDTSFRVSRSTPKVICALMLVAQPPVMC